MKERVELIKEHRPVSEGLQASRASVGASPKSLPACPGTLMHALTPAGF